MSGESVPLALPLVRLATDTCEVTILYHELRKPLLRYLVCLGLTADEAQDVVQDAFVSLHRYLAAGGSEENIRSWLFVWPTMPRATARRPIVGASARHWMPKSKRPRSMKRRLSGPCSKKKGSGGCMARCVCSPTPSASACCSAREVCATARSAKSWDWPHRR